jgi:hypothetical protein
MRVLEDIRSVQKGDVAPFWLLHELVIALEERGSNLTVGTSSYYH